MLPTVTALRDTVDDLKAAARLVRDLPGWLRAQIPQAQAQAEVRDALQTRAARFLWLVEHGVYAQPHSPYRVLLQHAGCEPGDMQALVRREGLEGALRHLFELGVYVTDDELKGRAPIVRGSLQLMTSFTQFLNPLVKPHLLLLTGGSSGGAARVPISLGMIRMLAVAKSIHHAAHGTSYDAIASWAMNPMPLHLAAAKIGTPIQLWLLPLSPLPREVRVMARLGDWMTQRHGLRMPPPTPCEIAAPETMARAIGTARARYGQVLVNCATSAAVRASNAARERGIRLDGVTFDVRSEPLTGARRRDVEASGASVSNSYGSAEFTFVAAGCPDRTAADDSHVYAHTFAVVGAPREPGATDDRAQMLLVTTLDPTAPVIGLNAQMGDLATVKVRPADCCLLGRLGLTTHVANIRSYDKLTGEGVTVARSDMLRVLEEQLPRQFGGTSVDYQLAEEAGADGLVRLILRISPRIGPLDEEAARAVLLSGLDKGGLVDRHMAVLWRQAGTVVIRRDEPVATAAGKVLPFHRGHRT